MSLLFPAQTITLDAALRDLASGGAKARLAAAHALGDFADPADPADRTRAAAALIRALDDDLASVRAEAAASLGEIGEGATGEVDAAAIAAAIARRLTDGDAAVRQNAAIALGSLRHPDGLGPLVTALREGPPDVRFQAATSLAEIDGAAAYEPLVAALADADPQVVGAAALSLGAIGDGRAVGPLVARLDHPDPGARFDAAYALAELRDARGRAVLTAALGDDARAWDAATALEWLGTIDDAHALAGLLTRRKADPNPVLRAAGAILRIARAAAVPAEATAAARRVLHAALGLRKLPLRGLAVQELATAGDAADVPALERLRASRKGRELADDIADALRQIGARA